MEEDFAALKLLDSDADSKLIQTVEYSNSPSSQHLRMRETFGSEMRPNLVRQFSYEQILHRNESTRQTRSSESPRFDNEYPSQAQTTEFFKSPSRLSLRGNNILQAPKFELRRAVSESQCNRVENTIDTNKITFRLPVCKPHLSPRQNKDNFDNTDDVIKQENVVDETNVDETSYQNVKTKLRPLVAKSKVPPKEKPDMCFYRFFSRCLTLFALPMIVVMFSLLVNLNVHTICERRTLFLNASQNLKQAIHGQDDSVSKIIAHLDQDFFYVKVICIIGGTGVGKSYTAEIIAKSFPLREKVYMYNWIFKAGDWVKRLESYHLIIMDQLKLDDLDTFVTVVGELSKRKEKCITVLAIFNVEDVNDYLERTIDLVQSKNKIAVALEHMKVDSIIVPYQPLTEDVLEMCIMEAAKKSDLELTQEQIYEIKQSLLISDSGCKGAYAKVQVVGRW